MAHYWAKMAGFIPLLWWVISRRLFQEEDNFRKVLLSLDLRQFLKGFNSPPSSYTVTVHARGSGWLIVVSIGCTPGIVWIYFLGSKSSRILPGLFSLEKLKNSLVGKLYPLRLVLRLHLKSISLSSFHTLLAISYYRHSTEVYLEMWPRFS